MYKCDNCDKVFDYPKRVNESDRGQVYTVEVCPRCGWDGFDNVELCRQCNEPEAVSRMQYDFCGKCAAETMKSYNAFLETLTEAEKDFLEGVLHDAL